MKLTKLVLLLVSMLVMMSVAMAVDTGNCGSLPNGDGTCYDLTYLTSGCDSGHRRPHSYGERYFYTGANNKCGMSGTTTIHQEIKIEDRELHPGDIIDDYGTISYPNCGYSGGNFLANIGHTASTCNTLVGARYRGVYFTGWYTTSSTPSCNLTGYNWDEFDGNENDAQ
jgi:hypothetical protein